MAMSWFWLIFIAVNLFSFNGLLDKFFCGKKFKNILTKKEVVSEVKVVFNDGKTVGTLFLRSLISFLAVCLFYLALKTGPISLVVGVILINQ